MTAPLVSVILPFYNAENTLHSATNSILNQSLEQWELILVDNASTDHSRSIAQSLAKQDTRIRLVNEPNRSVVSAFNAGLAQAQGAYIARMDADDISHPDRLKLQSDFLNKYSETDIVSGQVHYQSEVSQEGMQQYVNWVNSITTPKQILQNQFVELPTINPSLMFRRSALEKFGSYRFGDFPEDYELILRWLSQGAIISKVDDIVLDWHDSSHRLTRTDARYSTEAFYRIKTSYLTKWLEQNNPFYPNVVVWGAGRKSRQRAKLLEKAGITISAFIDVVPNKTNEAPCIFYQDIAPPGQYFILSYVSNRGRRVEIRDFLLAKGYREAIDFLLVA
ncbi:MAG: glycosyltransferase family 2 protein [Bacteroidota bacterium]